MLLRSILEELSDWLWGGDYESEDTVVLDVPACKQLDGHSCGLEVTRAALRYFGRRPSRQRLRKLLRTTRLGTSEDAIQTVLEDFGLGTRIIAGGTVSDLRRCIRAGEPVIVTVDDGEHWVVVIGYSPGRVSLMDPRPWVLTTRVASEAFERDWCEGWGIVVSGA